MGGWSYGWIVLSMDAPMGGKSYGWMVLWVGWFYRVDGPVGWMVIWDGWSYGWIVL